MSTLNKIKRIKVETSKGDRYLTFRYLDVEEEIGQVACEKVCPYGGKLCQKLKDPSKPNDELSRFIDFCGNVDDIINESREKSGEPGAQYYPMEGTLEENLYDIPEMNVFELIIKEGGYEKIDKIVDSVCEDECPLYTKDHSKCSPSVVMCMLHKILKNKDYDPSVLNKKEKEDKECNTAEAK